MIGAPSLAAGHHPERVAGDHHLAALIGNSVVGADERAISFDVASPGTERLGRPRAEHDCSKMGNPVAGKRPLHVVFLQLNRT